MFAKINHKQFQESIHILSPHNCLELKHLSSMCNRTLVHSSHPPPHTPRRIKLPGPVVLTEVAEDQAARVRYDRACFMSRIPLSRAAPPPLMSLAATGCKLCFRYHHLTRKARIALSPLRGPART